jgi:hypothetical protein
MKSASFFFSMFSICLSCSISSMSLAREWTDKTGNVKVNGTLIAADQKDIVVKLDQAVKGRELLAIAIAELSEADQKFLLLEESEGQLKTATEKHSWGLKNGMNVFGKVVGFNRKDVTLQRRRGKLYVNDRSNNLNDFPQTHYVALFVIYLKV